MTDSVYREVVAFILETQLMQIRGRTSVEERTPRMLQMLRLNSLYKVGTLMASVLLTVCCVVTCPTVICLIPTALVSFSVPPYFIHKPQNTYGRVNEDVMLSCDIQGFPTPKVSWLKVCISISRTLAAGHSCRSAHTCTLRLESCCCYCNCNHGFSLITGFRLSEGERVLHDEQA